MNEQTHPLGLAVRVGAAGDRFVFGKDEAMLTNRAALRHPDIFFTAVPLLDYRFHNFRDNITGSLDKDLVANH